MKWISPDAHLTYLSLICVNVFYALTSLWIHFFYRSDFLNFFISVDWPVRGAAGGWGPPRGSWTWCPRCWSVSPPSSPPLAACSGSPPPRCRCSRSSAAGFVAAAAAGSAAAASACRRTRPRRPPGPSAPCPRSRLQHHQQLNLLSTSESENYIKLMNIYSQFSPT